MGFLEGDWQERLALIDKTMREMSLQVDPQAMVRSYGTRMLIGSGLLSHPLSPNFSF